MRYAHVGEDKKTAIVGQQSQSLELESGCPADPPVPSLAFQSCAAPAQQGQPSVLVKCNIPQGLTDHGMKAEVVMLLHQLAPARFLCRCHRTNFNAQDYISGFWL